MTGIEIALAIFSVVSGTASLHSWFTGLKVGERRRMEEELSVNHIEVERLSDHILYAPSIQQVRDTTRTRQEHLEDGRQLRALLEPAQQGLQEDILSTAILSTPDKLREAFGRDPWEVLVEVRPLNRAQRPTNPALVPILFPDGGTQYIGWQMKGAMPILFNCEYDPEREGAGPSLRGVGNRARDAP